MAPDISVFFAHLDEATCMYRKAERVIWSDGEGAPIVTFVHNAERRVETELHDAECWKARGEGRNDHRLVGVGQRVDEREGRHTFVGVPLIREEKPLKRLGKSGGGVGANGNQHLYERAQR